MMFTVDVSMGELETLAAKSSARKKELYRKAMGQPDFPIGTLRQLAFDPHLWPDALRQLKARLPQEELNAFARVVAEEFRRVNSDWWDDGIVSGELLTKAVLTDHDAWSLWVLGYRSTSQALKVIEFTTSLRLLGQVAKARPDLQDKIAAKVSGLPHTEGELLDMAAQAKSGDAEKAEKESPKWQNAIVSFLLALPQLGDGGILYLATHQPSRLSQARVTPSILSNRSLAWIICGRNGKDSSPFLDELEVRCQFVLPDGEKLPWQLVRVLCAHVPDRVGKFADLEQYEEGDRVAAARELLQSKVAVPDGAKRAAADFYSSSTGANHDILKGLAADHPSAFKKLLSKFAELKWRTVDIIPAAKRYLGVEELSPSVLEMLDETAVSNGVGTDAQLVSVYSRRSDLWLEMLRTVAHMGLDGIERLLQLFPDRRSEIWAAVKDGPPGSMVFSLFVPDSPDADDEIALEALTLFCSQLRYERPDAVVRSHESVKDRLKGQVLAAMQERLKADGKPVTFSQYLASIGVPLKAKE